MCVAVLAAATAVAATAASVHGSTGRTHCVRVGEKPSFESLTLQVHDDAQGFIATLEASARDSNQALSSLERVSQ